MVELSGKSDPYQHSFPNIVFILPAIITLGLMGKLKVEQLHWREYYSGWRDYRKDCKGFIKRPRIPRNSQNIFFQLFVVMRKRTSTYAPTFSLLSAGKLHRVQWSAANNHSCNVFDDSNCIVSLVQAAFWPDLFFHFLMNSTSVTFSCMLHIQISAD